MSIWFSKDSLGASAGNYMGVYHDAAIAAFSAAKNRPGYPSDFLGDMQRFSVFIDIGYHERYYLSMSRKVVLYETRSGKRPVEEFVKSLSPKEQQKIVWGLKILEEGFALKEPYFKKIIGHDDLWELRITFGGNAFRVYFFEFDYALVVVLCGSQKKNDTAQKKDIAIAAEYMRDVQENGIENT